MKAVVIKPDQSLAWDDVPTVLPRVGEVAISVKASGINRADLMQRKGLYPPPPGVTDIPGLECAGIISAVGPAVTQWQVGQAVCALLAGGGHAESVVVAADHVLPMPRGFTFTQGAALPEVFATAWLNIFLEGGIRQGQRVLIHAGASGVGTAAIQLCKAFGVHCFVTVGSQDKLSTCLKLGADAGADRHDGPFIDKVLEWSGGKGVNLVLDCVGGQYLEANLKCLATDGRLVMIGIMGGRTAEIDLGRLLVKRLTVVGSTLRSRDNGSKARLVADLRQRVWPLFDEGRLRPVIHDEYPVQRVSEAFAALESNATTGKLILAF
jgi:putative PIG3 family NAD(P)H quinone oxidoreductase